MRALWPQLTVWLDEGEPFALATVTVTSGSAPRVPGTCMAILPDQSRFIGSVSSGCLDVEVVEAARAALRTGETLHLRFGPDGNPPWSDGLTCGGWVGVRVEPWWGQHSRGDVREIAPLVRRWLADGERGLVISSDTHHLALDAHGRLVGEGEAFPADLIARAQQHAEAELPPAEINHDGAKVFLRTIRRRPRMLIVGGVDVAVHLVALARTSGFATTVVDPRAVFVTPERFPVSPDELMRSWPQDAVARAALGPRDVALALTHDPKIDDVALLALLETRAGYIGALGSRRSHSARLERLRCAGADNSSLPRIHGPAGIHLGTPTAAGIALGMMAGVVQWQAEQESARLAAALGGFSGERGKADGPPKQIESVP